MLRKWLQYANETQGEQHEVLLNLYRGALTLFFNDRRQ